MSINAGGNPAMIIIPSRLKEKNSKFLHATETFYNGHLSAMAIFLCHQAGHCGEVQKYM